MADVGSCDSGDPSELEGDDNDADAGGDKRFPLSIRCGAGNLKCGGRRASEDERPIPRGARKGKEYI